MSTTTINKKANGIAVSLAPATAGERVLAKLLSEAEARVRSLQAETAFLREAKEDLERKVHQWQESFDFQAGCRQRYEDAYHDERYKRQNLMGVNADLMRELARTPAWLRDLGSFLANAGDAWDSLGRGITELVRELRNAVRCLQGQRG